MPTVQRSAGIHFPGDCSFQQLSFLIALEREQDLARAAAACQTSSAALIDNIRQIEADVGGRILVSDERFEGLTPLGSHLAAWARNLLQDFRRVYG